MNMITNNGFSNESGNRLAFCHEWMNIPIITSQLSLCKIRYLYIVMGIITLGGSHKILLISIYEFPH